MKRLVALTMSILFASGAVALAQQGHHHEKEGTKPVAMTGEILDLTCFMLHPDDAVGMEHAKCAKMCINKGLPVGFRTDDGTIYLVVGTGHDSIAATVADLAGKKSTITGTVIDHDGVKAIAMVSIVAKP